MKKYILIIAAIFFVMTLASAVTSADFDDNAISGLNITTDVGNSFDTAQNQNKSVIMIFDKDDCVYCDMFKQDVLSNSTIQKELNENFVVVLVDVNKNPDIAKKYRVFGTPTVQFLNSHGDSIKKIEGYVDSAEFLKTIKEI